MATPTAVHLVNSLRRGGSEGQAVLLVQLLRERGLEVALACFDADGPLLHELGDDPPELLVYPLTSLHDLSAARQLRRFTRDLRRRRVDVVHTHDVYANIFGLPAARLAGVPARIASRRDTGGVGTDSRRRVEGVLYRLADRIVTNADAVRMDLAAQGLPMERIVTIHNAVDFTRLEPGLDRAAALETFRLPSGRRFVVLVANLSHDVKNHPMFLRAARRIKDAAPDSAFVIAGHGPLVSELQVLAQELGIAEDLFFIGRCKAIGDLLAIAEVCVLTSRAEGLSNAVLEYMAAGRPVVATDVGGLREAVVDGETGYLVPSGDDRALAARVVSLLADPEAAARMGERGRQRIQTRFSCEQLVERTIRLYGDVLDGNHR